MRQNSLRAAALRSDSCRKHELGSALRAPPAPLRCSPPRTPPTRAPQPPLAPPAWPTSRRPPGAHRARMNVSSHARHYAARTTPARKSPFHARRPTAKSTPAAGPPQGGVRPPRGDGAGVAPRDAGGTERRLGRAGGRRRGGRPCGPDCACAAREAGVRQNSLRAAALRSDSCRKHEVGSALRAPPAPLRCSPPRTPPARAPQPPLAPPAWPTSRRHPGAHRARTKVSLHARHYAARTTPA